tara:strand:+ start:651 stop:1763 length:1113 start_codon:yes stop_codon:yes gene_type:complete
MNYYLNLFSVETWENFRDHGGIISGFSKNQRKQARAIHEGSIFLCYLVKLSRWIGALRVDSESFEDSKPIFKTDNDPFIIRFKVTPLVMLDLENSIPIREPEIWNKITWTQIGDKEVVRKKSAWGLNFQRSLRLFPQEDGKYIYEKILNQVDAKKAYPLTDREKQLMKPTVAKTPTGIVNIVVPDDDQELNELETEQPSNTSLEMQSALAKIGAEMGFQIWLPRNDLTRMKNRLDQNVIGALLKDIPINFNDAVIKTIQNIDVLWFRKQTIIRAFEVEHTTAIYSGLLRMADLVSMVPNIDLQMHIVAPDERREKVLSEINRPVFTLMEGNLAKRCSYLSYENVHVLLQSENLKHMNESIIDEYTETKDY